MRIKTYKGEKHDSSPRNIGYTAQYRLPSLSHHPSIITIDAVSDPSLFSVPSAWITWPILRTLRDAD